MLESHDKWMSKDLEALESGHLSPRLRSCQVFTHQKPLAWMALSFH